MPTVQVLPARTSGAPRLSPKSSHSSSVHPLRTRAASFTMRRGWIPRTLRPWIREHTSVVERDHDRHKLDLRQSVGHIDDAAFYSERPPDARFTPHTLRWRAARQTLAQLGVSLGTSLVGLTILTVAASTSQRCYDEPDFYAWPRGVQHANVAFNAFGGFVVQLLNIVLLRELFGHDAVPRWLIAHNVLAASFDALYRVVVFAVGLQDAWWRSPVLNLLFVSMLVYSTTVVARRVEARPAARRVLTRRVVTPMLLATMAVLLFRFLVIGMYTDGSRSTQLMLSVGVPLLFTWLFAIGRSCAVRLYCNHPGTSYIVLLLLVAFTSAMQRILQAGLGSLVDKVVTGVVVGGVELATRRTVLWRAAVFELLTQRKKLDPLFFSYPRRRRLLSDLIVFGTFMELWAVVIAEGWMLAVRATFGGEGVTAAGLWRFVSHTAVQLAIEVGVDIVAYTHEAGPQNMPVFRTWSRRSWNFVKATLLITCAGVLNSVGDVIPLYVSVLGVGEGRLEEYCRSL